MKMIGGLNMREVHRLAQLLSLLSLAVSAPMGVVQYYRARVAERQAAVDRTYDALDDRYTSFQVLCMQHVDLDCYDRPLIHAARLSSEDSVRQRLIYTVLLSMLERAYIQYQRKSVPSAKEQWAGWGEYAAAFSPRTAFRATWGEVRTEYDTGFRKFMDSLMTTAAHAR